MRRRLEELEMTAGQLEREVYRHWIEGERNRYPDPLSPAEEVHLARGYARMGEARAAMLAGRATDPRVVAHIAESPDGRNWLRAVLVEGNRRMIRYRAGDSGGRSLPEWRAWARALPRGDGGLPPRPRPATARLRVPQPGERGGSIVIAGRR